MNQCDGCRCGLPTRLSNFGLLIHYDPERNLLAYMACEKERYLAERKETQEVQLPESKEA